MSKPIQTFSVRSIKVSVVHKASDRSCNVCGTTDFEEKNSCWQVFELAINNAGQTTTTRICSVCALVTASMLGTAARSHYDKFSLEVPV